MADDKRPLQAGGIAPRVRFRMLGTPAPVFPGFEVDILDRVPDSEKPDAVWHRDRARAMLKDHPEIKDLAGNTPSTAIWCLFFAGLQVALAAFLSTQPIWLLILVAYVVGSWININLFMLGHECNHSLVFKNATLNRWLYSLTTLPMFLPGHHTWWLEHPVHHSDLGAKKDFIKRRRTAFLITKYWPPLLVPFVPLMLIFQVLRTVLGLTTYLLGLLVGKVRPGQLTLTILGDEHLVSGYRKGQIAAWAVVYATLSIALGVTLGYFFGWKALLYLFASQAFLGGFLHPLMLGMILSNSHFHGHDEYQPSSSYYGWLNKLTFNFGLHTEHHDLQSIPWSRLPAIRKAAPEQYDNLLQTKSYIALALQFVFGNREPFENEEHRNAKMQEQAEVGENALDSEQESQQSVA